MSLTESQKKAYKTYHEKLDEIKIRVPKGSRADISMHAAKNGESLNAFVRRAIDETIERDNFRKQESENNISQE